MKACLKVRLLTNQLSLIYTHCLSTKRRWTHCASDRTWATRTSHSLEIPEVHSRENLHMCATHGAGASSMEICHDLRLVLASGHTCCPHLFCQDHHGDLPCRWAATHPCRLLVTDMQASVCSQTRSALFSNIVRHWWKPSTVGEPQPIPVHSNLSWPTFTNTLAASNSMADAHHRHSCLPKHLE